MAETSIYDIPYPTLSSPVNVSGDIQALAERIDVILPTIGLPYHTLEVTNNSGVSIFKTDPVYISGYDSLTGKPEISRSNATDVATFPVVGLAQSAIGDGTDGVIVLSGVFTGVDTSSYTVGNILYTNSGGGLTTTKPTSGSGVVGVVSKSDINGVILVGSFKGNGTWGSLKAGLA
jgi:hypothetical protein